METWQVSQGEAPSYTVTINDASGNPVPYTGTEALSGAVWAGNDQEPLFVATVTWYNAAGGQVVVALPAAQTAGLAVGLYRFRLLVTDAAGPHDAYESRVYITAAPGAAALRPTYITAADVRKVASWIDDLQDADNQEAGFLDQCADARDWLDEIILRNYRGGNITLLGYHGLALDAWYTGGVRRTSLANIWLKTALQNNQLLITPRIKRVQALYAAHLIAGDNISKGKQFLAMAARYRMEANSLLIATTAELCLSGDGFTPNVPINFSTTNTLFG